MIHRLNYKKEKTPMVKQNYHRRYFYKKEENICRVLFLSKALFGFHNKSKKHFKVLHLHIYFNHPLKNRNCL